MYEAFKSNPESVEDGWRVFFSGFEFGENGNSSLHAVAENGTSFDIDELKVVGLINGYRRRGHLLSTTNPIRERRDRRPYLALEDYGLQEADLDRTFRAAKEIGYKEPKTLREIMRRLHKIYCGSIGLEYFYIAEKAKRRWLRQQLETFRDDDYGLSFDKKKRILGKTE